MQTTDQRPLTKHIFKTSKGENLYYEKTDNIPGCIIHCSIYCIHGFSREFDTSKLKRILQSLETGLFFCQIFVFII